MTIETSIQAGSATAADVINIPNPATPTLKPSNFSLATALASPVTISWTQPTFQVDTLFVNPNVYVSPTGQGFFCSVQDSQFGGNLDPGTTQATITFPRTCNGQPVQQASVCIFYIGTGGETSDACWFWSTMAPDLTITAISAPSSGTRGSPISVSATVINVGSAASGPFRISWYISPSTASAPGTGVLVAQTDEVSLGTGGSVMAPATFTIPPITPGTYALSAVATSLSVTDPNPSNNGFTSPTPITIN
ncbi:MAG TPA: CARDB domain-containing protein [Methylomirabilota bacterium]|nr:CARDB domain-containing protein [Methylomirabilota bacterium]